MNLFRGEACSQEDFVGRICTLQEQISEDLSLPILGPEIVIAAVDRLANLVTKDSALSLLKIMGIDTTGIEDVLEHTLEDMKREALTYKLSNELNAPLGEWRTVIDNSGKRRRECYLPLGVLLHIGAGNTIGLSAYSVIEGLLTGNINLLKLPEGEAGISYFLLEQLIRIEPRLKPYIYMTDLSSSRTYEIHQLAEASDAVIAWGRDETIQALRGSLPAHKPLIEWGHKIGFAYFSEGETTDLDLRALADEMCQTNQLYCSSPQCILYEASEGGSYAFAERLENSLKESSKTYPQKAISQEQQAEITFLHQTLLLESHIKGVAPFTDAAHSYGVMISDISELRASPLYRNIWIIPIRREALIQVLRPHIGHLQTVGLSVPASCEEEIKRLLFRAGITKITKCGEMYLGKRGESHDGKNTLSLYVKKVDDRER
ncbi:MAG: hypothetical protein BGO41_09785 [Clostridiales bacterium 38-18]|nr:MAG: hypothetical protein BGO41_09785 [Clostridiales bacterium 38-18]